MSLKWGSVNRFQLLQASDHDELDDTSTDIPARNETDTPTPTTNFLDLPRELRDMIYRNALVPLHPIEFAPLHAPRASHRSGSAWHILHFWLNLIGHKNRQQLRHITVTYPRITMAYEQPIITASELP